MTDPPPRGKHPGITDDTFADPTAKDRRHSLADRVQLICALREGDAAKIERRDCAAPFDEYILVSKWDGTVFTQHMIAALNGTITMEAFQTLNTTLDLLRLEDGWMKATIIYDGDLPSEEVTDAARRRRVSLRSLEEYRGLIDFRTYAEWQLGRLNSDPIYRPSLYVEQRANVSVGREESHSRAALGEVLKLLDTEGARFIVVLGDFGTGKTFLLHEVARRLASGASARLIPVLIEMRALEKARQLNALVAQHLSIAGMNQFNLAAFRYMLADGRIALLFDGFDELALRVSYDKAIEHFDTLIDAVQGNAKVVVTSRSQHFFSDEQVRTVLANRAAEISGYRLIHLRPFQDDQILAFLRNLLDSEERANARFALLEEVRDLLGLSANPRMLSLIAEVPEDQLKEAKQRHGTITAAALYQLILERWFTLEDIRSHPRGATGGLLPEDRWRAVTSLALRLWEKTEATVNVSELPQEIAVVLQSLSAHAQQMDGSTVIHQVGSATLLVRDAVGNFAFLHHSVLDWLVARAAAEEVRRKGASDVLATREMSDLMADFFTALAGNKAAESWAERGLTAKSGLMTSNALRVLRRLGVNTPDHLDLAGKNLRGQDLTGRNLRMANLREADLRDATLVGADLAGALLEGTKLCRANLSEARLISADLRRADLSSARLLGADLSHAKLAGAQFRAAKLVGAKLDAGALDNANAEGAALSAEQRIEPMISSASHCNAVAWSKDGTLLATGHDDGSVRLWDVVAGTALRVLRGHSLGVMSVAWHPQEMTLASASEDGTVRLWNAWTGAAQGTLSGCTTGALSVAWSPDGSRLAVGRGDGKIQLWDGGTWTKMLKSEGHTAQVLSVAWNPQGTMVAGGSKYLVVRVWDVETGNIVHTLFGHIQWVMSVAFDRTGSMLASGGYDGTIHLWDMKTGEVLQVLQPGDGRILSVAWSPDGKTLASGGGTVRLWDPSTGNCLHVFKGHEHWVRSVAWSPDGTALASGSSDRTVRVWDAVTRAPIRVLRGHEHWIRSVAWSPDGATLASGSSDRTVRLWDTRMGTSTRVLEGHVKGVRSVAWRPDGEALASGSSDGTVHIWDAGRAALVRVFKEHTNWVRSVAWNPEGTLVASASSDGTVRLWDVEKGGPARVFAGHRKAVLSVAWSPDGTMLASSSADNTVRLWKIEKDEAPRVLKGGKDWVTSVTWSPDGAMLASGSSDGTVLLWSVASGKVTSTMSTGGREVMSVSWSPDGSSLAGGLSDGTVQLWNVLGVETGELSRHEQAIMSVAWSPDGATLASGSYDGTLRLWDVAAGVCLSILLPQPCGWAAFTKDGRYKLGGDVSGAFWHVVGLCRFDPGELDGIPGRRPSYLPKPLRVPDGAPLFTLPSGPKPSERKLWPGGESRKKVHRSLFLGAPLADTGQSAELPASLPDDEIRNIHMAALNLGLGRARDALLGGLDPTVSQGLPRAADPSSQLLSDLYALNTTTLRDGRSPLATWLSNALHITRAQTESRVFSLALAALRRR